MANQGLVLVRIDCRDAKLLPVNVVLVVKSYALSEHSACPPRVDQHNNNDSRKVRVGRLLDIRNRTLSDYDRRGLGFAGLLHPVPARLYVIGTHAVDRNKKKHCSPIAIESDVDLARRGLGRCRAQFDSSFGRSARGIGATWPVNLDTTGEISMQRVERSLRWLARLHSPYSTRSWRGHTRILAIGLCLLGSLCYSSLSVANPGAGLQVNAISNTDALRFLAQASFGATDAELSKLQTSGFNAYLNDQFAAPLTQYTGFSYVSHTRPDTCRYDSNNPTGPASLCARDHYTLFQVQRQFFQNAMNGRDQLRQRVAFALSQIFVVSGTEIYEAYGMAAYQNMLLKHAFGNFRDLLVDVSLSPVMGNYLDMVNNQKPNPNRGTVPNENYARELLQLFSIGINKLNIDGTEKIDAQGKPIPAYDEEVIKGYAHLLTGWTYPPRPGATSVWRNPINYEGSMVAFPDYHDTGAKTVLDGRVIPAGQTPQKDLTDGLDAVFRHPNVGPFIGKQLIQHLVTSNPSRKYVARVAAAFNNNGRGVRGDMKTVIRAILLDPEARSSAVSPVYGHLREPVLFITSILRGLNGQTDGVFARNQSTAMGQNVFYSPSVFNYYPPDFVLAGTNTLAPEFAIQNTITSLNRANFVFQLVYQNGAAADQTVVGSTGTSLDLSALLPLAANPDALVESLNQRLMAGTLSSAMRGAILQAINKIPASDATNRVRMASYLTASSQQFQVER